MGALTMRERQAPPSLRLARGLIDAVDGALLALLAARQRLGAQAAQGKRRAGLPLRDAAREAQVHARTQRMAAHLGLRAGFAHDVVEAAIRETHARQCEDAPAPGTRTAARLLRWLPPPSRLAPFARRVPARWQRRALEAAMARVLGPSLAAGELAFLEGRSLGIEVADLGLHWTVGLREGRLASVDDAPEASVRGSATDLLLLAGRCEDADTLFFQRRLVLTGDTELGLTARNLLEGLRWDTVPLGLRIALARGARAARAARQARREAASTGGGHRQQA